MLDSYSLKYIEIMNFTCVIMFSHSLSAYSLGKEYVYDYETQAVTGFPKGSKTWSGLRVSSQVLVQVSSPDRLTVQVGNTVIVGDGLAISHTPIIPTKRTLGDIGKVCPI